MVFGSRPTVGSAGIERVTWVRKQQQRSSTYRRKDGERNELLEVIVCNQSMPPEMVRLLASMIDADTHITFYTGRTSVPSDLGPRARTVAGPSYRRTGVVGRVASWIAFTLWLAARLAVDRRTAEKRAVIAYTNPPMIQWIAALHSRLTDATLILEQWDLYPEHISSSMPGPISRLLARPWRWMNELAIRQAQCVRVISDSMRDCLVRCHPRAEAKIRVRALPYLLDIEHQGDDRDPEDRSDRLAVADLCVLYSGNMGLGAGLAPVIDLARKLTEVDQERRVRVLLVGDGLVRDRLTGAVTAEGLSNVTFVTRQPWAVVPEILSLADVAIVSQSHASGNLSAPSKLASHCAFGTPILAIGATDSELLRLVRAESIGYSWDPGASESPEGCAQWLVGLAEEPSRLSAIGSRSLQLAQRMFSPLPYRRQLWEDIVGPGLGTETRMQPV